MTQITLTLDLTGETLDALRVLVDALNGVKEPSPKKAKTKETPAPAPKEPTGTEDMAPADPGDGAEVESLNESLEISKADVRAAALKLSKAKKQAELKEIFAKYGGAKLSDIAEGDYAALLADLEEAANG
jgi:hypothetical protein